MEKQPDIITINLEQNFWERFYKVAPLVLVGSREQDGTYNQAPKHMAMPLGWYAYFGFVCTSAHRTYHNVEREKAFTVSYPRPSQVVLSSMAAGPRWEDSSKPTLEMLPTFPAIHIDGRFVADGYLFLECEMDRVIDGFGENSLISGRIVAAHVHANFLRDVGKGDDILLQEAPLLAYIDPGRFARISETYPFPFPRGFKR